jgi:hypothetical protein
MVLAMVQKEININQNQLTISASVCFVHGGMQTFLSYHEKKL